VIYRQYLFRGELPLLNRGLDAYALRQKTVASNIANATTPDYKPQNVKFEEFFNDAVETEKGVVTNEKHIPIGMEAQDSDVEAQVQTPPVPEPEVYFSGDSHVNIDKEMANLAQNQIKYRFAARAVHAYFQDLQNAITGLK
jgi:flagellar basal-body rod protein FlgB